MSFISDNIGKHGYLSIPPLRSINGVEQPKFPAPVFTENNHLVYGYSNKDFSQRENLNELFFVEYGRPTTDGPFPSLNRAFDAALLHIANTYGRIGIHADDTMFSRSVRMACLRLKIDFIEIQIDLEGHPGFQTLNIGPAYKHQVSDSEFRNFLARFAKTTHCTNTTMGFRALMSEVTDLPCIYWNYPSHATNLNMDRTSTHHNPHVGPPLWSVPDKEDEYAINKWLHYSGKRGIPNLWKYSPELIRAFYDHAETRRLIADYDNNIAKQSGSTEPAIKRLIPVATSCFDLKSMLNTELDFQELATLRRDWYNVMGDTVNELMQVNFRHEHVQLIPFHRWLKHMKLDYGNSLNDSYVEIYGDVA